MACLYLLKTEQKVRVTGGPGREQLYDSLRLGPWEDSALHKQLGKHLSVTLHGSCYFSEPAFIATRLYLSVTGQVKSIGRTPDKDLLLLEVRGLVTNPEDAEKVNGQAYIEERIFSLEGEYDLRDRTGDFTILK